MVYEGGVSQEELGKEHAMQRNQHVHRQGKAGHKDCYHFFTMCRNSLDLFAGFLQKNITCLLSTFTTMCWDIQDGSDPRCSKGDRWI